MHATFLETIVWAHITVIGIAKKFGKHVFHWMLSRCPENSCRVSQFGFALPESLESNAFKAVVYPKLGSFTHSVR